MIHRRTQPSSSSSSSAAATPPLPPPRPTVNQAYVPLRQAPAPVLIPSPHANPQGHAAYGSAPGQGGGSPFGPGGPHLELEDARFGFGERTGPAAGVQGAVVRALRELQAGVRDVVRLDRSWGLVWDNRELRSVVLKLTLLNLLSLTLLSLFPLVLSPIIHGSGMDGSRASRASQVSWWYNVLLSWPTFAVIFWINSLWGPDVARRAQNLLHPAYRHQPSSGGSSKTGAPSFPDDPAGWAWMTFTRLLLIADFTLVFRVLILVPVLGWPLGLGYMALINAYYAYEWIFVSRAWGLDQRCSYISDRSAYMLGFATLLTTFGSPMLNMAIFTLIYPFLVIQALQSRPSATQSLLSSPSSPSTPTTPDMFGNHTPSKGSGFAKWTDYARVHVFFFARNALDGTKFVVDAVMRERGGYASRRRGSKRAM